MRKLIEKLKAASRKGRGPFYLLLLPAAKLKRVLSWFWSGFRHDTWLLKGQELHSGESLTIGYCGMDYQREYTKRIAFRGEPEEIFLGKQFIWAARGLISRRFGKPDILFWDH